jgi:hypothetical protein
MNFIKEVHEETRLTAIRTDTYSHSLEYFQELFREAQKDFPGLSAKECEVVVYSGDRIKFVGGIEFTAPATLAIPVSYRRVAQFEHTLY